MRPALRMCLICVVALALATSAQAGPWSDNFDSYAAGSFAGGQGGWEGWDGSAAAGQAPIFNDISKSPPNSVEIGGPTTDLVHALGASSGKWSLSAQVYVPTQGAGDNYWVVMNNYTTPGGPFGWSGQLRIDMNASRIVDDMAGGAELPLIRGEWSKILMEIDLDANTADTYYNDQPLSLGRQWSDGNGDNLIGIAALDLYGNSASSIFYDDIDFQPLQAIELIPEPATMTLLAAAIAGMGGYLRRRKS